MLDHMFMFQKNTSLSIFLPTLEVYKNNHIPLLVRYNVQDSMLGIAGLQCKYRIVISLFLYPSVVFSSVSVWSEIIVWTKIGMGLMNTHKETTGGYKNHEYWRHSPTIPILPSCMVLISDHVQATNKSQLICTWQWNLKKEVKSTHAMLMHGHFN